MNNNFFFKLLRNQYLTVVLVKLRETQGPKMVHKPMGDVTVGLPCVLENSFPGTSVQISIMSGDIVAN